MPTIEIAMRVTCAECQREVPADDVNVAADTAYCRGCGTLTKLSELVGASSGGGLINEPNDELGQIDTSDIPRGCSSRNDGRRHIVQVKRGAGLGTIATTFGFMAFWNGITSVFVVIAFVSTMGHLGVELPVWFPTPEMDDGPMSPGMTAFLWLFLTPFILIGTCMFGAFIYALLGKIAVTVEGGDGSVFTGVGPVGWRRRFKLEDVTGVTLGKTSWQKNGQSQPTLEIATRGGGQIRFGSTLTAQRRAWMGAELRRLFEDTPRLDDFLSRRY